MLFKIAVFFLVEEDTDKQYNGNKLTEQHNVFYSGSKQLHFLSQFCTTHHATISMPSPQDKYTHKQEAK